MYRCKICERSAYRMRRKRYSFKEKDKRYYELHKIEIQEKRKLHYLSNKEKYQAHSKVNYALRSGKIEKAKACELCNKNDDLHAHHSNYMQPLNINWLCRSCHMLKHHGKN